MRATALAVHITEDHIRRGKRESCTECPAALALVDAGLLPEFAYVNFTLNLRDCWLGTSEPEEGEPTVPLPVEVAVWASSFDNGRPVSPMTFHADIPNHMLKRR